MLSRTNSPISKIFMEMGFFGVVHIFESDENVIDPHDIRFLICRMQFHS